MTSASTDQATTPARSMPVLVLQGGGALGYSQAAAYHALCNHDFRPECVAGISIGAVNCAIIAGSTPEQRVGRLKEFWQMATAPVPWRPSLIGDQSHSAFHEAAAAFVATFGVP